MEQIRRVIFRPYRPGAGPRFTLTLWDANRRDAIGKWVLRYRLTVSGGGRGENGILFEGEDFACSPMDATDSDATVAGIMTFLTLRPGDTDKDYFENYTPEQLAYCGAHAEALSAEVEARFGERP